MSLAAANRFVDLRQLGEGAEGGAWVARDRDRGGRSVVLKRTGSAGARAFALLRQVASPHLPEVQDWLRLEDEHWLVTAYVEGRALGPGPVDVARALADVAGAAHALAEIHATGIHHGDVAPDNVVATPTGGTMLTDFGFLGERGSGTPGYLAPEVLAGGGGPAADRFALGSMLCYRLFGEPPWRAPDALVAVRGAADVERRLDAMSEAAAVPLGQALRSLLAGLLDPDPERRPDDTDALVERLRRLQAVYAVGLEPTRVVSWHVPRRWPYAGSAPQEVVSAIRANPRPRLVVVAGPRGSGRRRVVEETIASLQGSGDEARALTPDQLGRALGSSEGWVDAWLAGRGTGVFGATESLSWPGSLRAAPRAQALVLREGAATSGPTLVVPMDPAAARELADERGVAVVELEAFEAAEVRALVDASMDADEAHRERWAEALMRNTRGLRGATVKALELSARAELETPDPAALDRAREEQDERAPLSREEALSLVEASWTPGLAEAKPAPWRLAAARSRLGPLLKELARTRLDALGKDAHVPFALALDAEHEASIAAHLLAEQVSREEWARGLEWLEGRARLDANLGTAAARECLRRGEHARALRFVEGLSQPSARLEAARALHRCGDRSAALEALGDQDCARARALRWNLEVELGRAGEVAREFSDWQPSPSEAREDVALARLWGCTARAASGHDVGVALAQAIAEFSPETEEAATPRAWGVQGRLLQFAGNLAHERGDLEDAAHAYTEAASAFDRAGETLGRALIEANLAAILTDAGHVGAAAKRGRAALRGLVARGDSTFLPAASVNLVAALARLGAQEEARRVLELGRALCPPDGVAADLSRTRYDVAELELDLLLPETQRDVSRLHAADRLAQLAERLTESAPREATDAWLRAARAARVEGETQRAAAWLERARQSAPHEDWRATLQIALERLAGAEDDEALVDAGRALAQLPGAAELLERGERELALRYDRTLLVALQRRHGTHHPASAPVIRRILATLENIMSDVPKLDRKAVRRHALSDAGDEGPLHALVRELEGDAGSVASNDSPRRGSEERHDRILRLYRRLAREDRLERLLEQIVEAMMELTDAERGMVEVGCGAERVEVAREISDGTDEIEVSRSVIDTARKTAEPVISVDAASDARFDGSRSVSHLNLRSVLAVPLIFRGEVLGAAYVDHRLRRGAFGEADLAAMEDFADLAALAVAQARSLERLKRQAAELGEQEVKLRALLDEREVEVRGLREEVRSGAEARGEYRGMVGASEAMQRVFRLVDRLADSEVPVVVYGESGTGKELVARAIHDAGPRAKRPFVAENCGAIPETLLESVLFGHAKGAFTGAGSARPGLFEAADGGTIFLDEVGEMSPAMQTKLLRVLQEGEVRRVGENSPRKVDVRVIAASNKDLEAMVAKGSFRQDLYYRIHVVKVALPPLRERHADIPHLVEHFLSLHGAETLGVKRSAMKRLAQYPWPGNVRELENEVLRWVALSEGKVGLDDLSDGIREAALSPADDPDDLRLKPRVERLERELIARALARTADNQTQAASLLGLSRFGLQKKLRRFADADAVSEAKGEEAQD